MKKIIIILFLILLVLSTFILAEKVAVITEVLKPTTLALDDNRFYVTEGATIFIYSLKDYRFIKKFGREGQGPQEFAVIPELPVIIDVSKEYIFVNSLGKVSYFSKEGDFIKEIKTKGFGWRFSPLKEGYIGFGRTAENKVAYDILNLYDSELNRGKEIARNKLGNPEKKIELLKRTLTCQVYGNETYVTVGEGFVIDVFDYTGNKLYSITREYERVKFNPRFEKEIRDNIKKFTPEQYEILKNRLAFPEYFPAISFLFIENEKIFVGTWNLQGDELEFYILSVKGELLKKKFVTIAFQEGSLTPYPMTFKDGKLYQLIENEEEEWELHVSPID